MSWPHRHHRHHSRHHISQLDALHFPAMLDAEDVSDQLLFPSDLVGPGAAGPGVSGPDEESEVEIIDHESLARSLVGLSPTAQRPASPRARHVSAVPRAEMMTVSRASLPWGLGTDGWPRHLSRHVRLFFGDHHRLATIAAARAWDRLVLGEEIDQLDDDDKTLVIAGTLQMPYPSRPLQVELRLQPFEARFVRVDLVLTSRHRYPRRYFDVASLALSAMQEIEAAPMPVISRRDPMPNGNRGS